MCKNLECSQVPSINSFVKQEGCYFLSILSSANKRTSVTFNLKYLFHRRSSIWQRKFVVLRSVGLRLKEKFCYLKKSFFFLNKLSTLYYIYWTCIIVIVENKSPTWCHLLFLFHFLWAQNVSDINISIIRSLRLFCWVTTLIVCSWFDVCWSFGVVGLEWYPCCRLKHNCNTNLIRILFTVSEG